MSQSINNENNLQVYINGVYQSKDTYDTSGSTLTLTTAPATGAKIEVVHIKPVDVTSLNSDVFTGNGTQTVYDLTATPSEAAKTLVFIQGVYQEKSTYSISGNTITFTTAPPNGYTIEVTVFGRLAVSDNTIIVERFTGDGSDTSFDLASSPSANNVDVYISGLYQNKNSYTYSSGTITFDEAPDNGAIIEAKHISGVTQVMNPLSVSVISANTDAQKDYLYVLTATCTLTLPSAPSIGDSIKISNRSGVATATVARNGKKIMGAAEDLTLDKLNSGFEMIFSGDAEGWILIGIEGTT